MSRDLLDTMILDLTYRIGIGDIDKNSLSPKLLKEISRVADKNIPQYTHILSISEFLTHIAKREGMKTLDKTIDSIKYII